MRQQTLPSLAKDFLIIFLAYHNSLAHPKALLCGQHRKELRALYKLHMHACNHTNFQVNFFWKTQRSILLNQENEVSKYVCNNKSNRNSSKYRCVVKSGIIHTILKW